MSAHALVYFIVIHRRGGRINKIDLFERVAVEIVDSFKVRLFHESSVFKFTFLSEQVLVANQGLDERENYYFSWYDEKYICSSAAEVYDEFVRVGVPDSALSWIAGRI